MAKQTFQYTRTARRPRDAATYSHSYITHTDETPGREKKLTLSRTTNKMVQTVAHKGRADR